jgi:hypothetical protein
VYGISEDKLNCGLHRGSYNLLMRVSGYGGGLDDSNVRVEVQSSPGLEEPFPYECDVPGWEGLLSWDGPLSPDYAWKIDLGSLNTVTDPTAYVKNGYLVAHFPGGAELALPGDNSVYSGLSLKLAQSVLTARIELDNSKIWNLSDGVLGGRIGRDDLVTTLRRTGFCDTTVGAAYDQVVSTIDGSLDVLADGANDALLPCDALSIGIAFQARQAKVGAGVTVAPPAECVGN